MRLPPVPCVLEDGRCRGRSPTPRSDQAPVSSDLPLALDALADGPEDVVRARLDDLRGLLERNQEGAKKVLDALFEGRITFTPMEPSDGSQRYWLEGRAVVGHLFVEEPTGVTKCASPAGFETAPR